jgi:hypothetical protein
VPEPDVLLESLKKVKSQASEPFPVAEDDADFQPFGSEDETAQEESTADSKINMPEPAFETESLEPEHVQAAPKVSEPAASSLEVSIPEKLPEKAQEKAPEKPAQGAAQGAAQNTQPAAAAQPAQTAQPVSAVQPAQTAPAVAVQPAAATQPAQTAPEKAPEEQIWPDESGGFSMNGVRKIEFRLKSGSLVFKQADGDRLILEDNFSTGEAGGAEGIMLFNGASAANLQGKNNVVTVQLPRNYAGELRINSESGFIRADTNIETQGKIEISTSSGSITLKNITGKEIILRSEGGGVSSGRITGPVNLSLVSGVADISISEIAGDVSCSVRSGVLKLSLPQNASYYLDAEITAGRLNIRVGKGYTAGGTANYRRTIGLNPKYKVTVRMTAGNLDINNL